MKVAYYSPMPPNRSGIADYSAHLLPALGRRLELEVARPGHHPRADVRLYHVGNDPDAHGWIVDALRERPGVVVLHEHVLHHLIAGITIGRGDGSRRGSRRPPGGTRGAPFPDPPGPLWRFPAKKLHRGSSIRGRVWITGRVPHHNM